MSMSALERRAEATQTLRDSCVGASPRSRCATTRGEG